MTQDGYKIRNQNEKHFISFAVTEWVDVFNRQVYRDIVLDSIRYCQENKGMLLNAWCIMTNHLHLILSSKTGSLSDIISDFKKYTSRQLIHSICNNPSESRREWMLNIFTEAGSRNSRNKSFQFWRQSLSRTCCGNNHPVVFYSPAFTLQKLNYLHHNPVDAGWVAQPEHYLYSSANVYVTGTKCGLLKIEFL